MYINLNFKHRVVTLHGLCWFQRLICSWMRKNKETGCLIQ